MSPGSLSDFPSTDRQAYRISQVARRAGVKHPTGSKFARRQPSRALATSLPQTEIAGPWRVESSRQRRCVASAFIKYCSETLIHPTLPKAPASGRSFLRSLRARVSGSSRSFPTETRIRPQPPEPREQPRVSPGRRPPSNPSIRRPARASRCGEGPARDKQRRSHRCDLVRRPRPRPRY